MLGQQLAHLHMTAVFLLPLVALTVVRFVREELDGRGLAWRLGVLLGLQFWLSTELFFTAILALGVALLLAFGARPGRAAATAGARAPAARGSRHRRARHRRRSASTRRSGFTSDSINDPRLFNGDLLGFVVPTHLIGIGGATFASVAAHFPASDAERGAYLGLPTLLIAALLRRPGAPFTDSRASCVASLGLAAFATLGTKLLVEGHVVVTLPGPRSSGCRSSTTSCRCASPPSPRSPPR